MRKNGVKQNFTVALFELMNLKPYDKISISDLVSKSACSRASFYRNYSSKEQIIEEYITKAFGNTFVRHPLNKENMREEVLCIFREINESGQTILMVTHSIKAASKAGRVLFIKDGEVFHQLYRGAGTDEEMFTRISDTLTMLQAGGNMQAGGERQ